MVPASKLGRNEVEWGLGRLHFMLFKLFIKKRHHHHHHHQLTEHIKGLQKTECKLKEI